MFYFFFHLQTQNNNSTRYKLQAWLRFIAHCSLCTHISYVAFKHHIQRFYLPHVVTQITASSPKLTVKNIFVRHAIFSCESWLKTVGKMHQNIMWGCLILYHHNLIIKIYQYARQIQSMHHQQALDSFQSVNVLIKKWEIPHIM